MPNSIIEVKTMSLDIIKLLPDSVANQIAAGEVVQRPASVVKELMENAVDAGATQIDVIVKDAGRTMICVVDNGCGMSDTDARLCFERHATSKIKEANDLFAIRTMGFRGEALASVAAVAQVELMTRREEDELGTKVLIEGSLVKDQTLKPMSKGSCFTVKNLFFNVPARRNFLKTNEAEMRHITEEFFRITMMHPDIVFTLTSNDKKIYHLNKGSLKQRIVGLMGKDYDQRLLSVSQETENVSIKGFVVKPEFLRKTRGEQYFFVNKRFIKHSYLHHAVENAYKELIPQDCFPGYFLNIEIDPKEIDINIHPTKTEVNFQNVKLIYAIMHSAVRKAIGQFNLSPTIDFTDNPNETGIDFALVSDKKISPIQPKINYNDLYNPFMETKPVNQSKGDNWRLLYDDLNKNEDFSLPLTAESIPTETPDSLYIQFQPYIVTSMKSGLLVINQHLAHERILYEKYLKEMETSVRASQQELFPLHLTLNNKDASLLKELKPELEKLGFQIDTVNVSTFIINGTPADSKDMDTIALIDKILENYKTNMNDLQFDRKLNLARTMSSQIAIKESQSLTIKEMQNIVDSLFACSVPEVAPNGKKIYVILTADELKTRFN